MQERLFLVGLGDSADFSSFGALEDIIMGFGISNSILTFVRGLFVYRYSMCLCRR